ncbi:MULTISPECIES: hypothetical protein [unclassified Acinetobacter]|uniref:hypothetical protein n=1 Tax=unclassified Acinetobacter TaxID=196816 RepID=UPI0018ECC595|nr:MULTISPECIES: hypothetical protein [unclassified Acinetobacter]MBJ6351290.1 hypothetical protein [Acinetobacter sp. c1]MBM0956916.1 hypothetical protein [Acinetobacter sp. C13]
MEKYDYYGVSYDNEENMILKLSEILGVVFIPHDSSFWGDYFLAKIDGKAECRLFQNFNPCEDEWNYPDHKHVEWILEVDGICEIDNIFNKLLNEANSNVFLLYRSEVEALNYSRRYKFKDGNFKLIREFFFKKN